MKKPAVIVIPGSTLVLLLMFSCAARNSSVLPGAHNISPEILPGCVYTSENLACPGVIVELYREGESKPVRTTETDLQGRFCFTGPFSGYTSEQGRLLFTKEGMEETELNIPVSGSGGMIYVRMFYISELVDSAESAIDSGNFSTAEDVLSRVLESEPENPEALFLLAVVSIKLNNREDAAAALEKIIAAGVCREEIGLILQEFDGGGE